MILFSALPWLVFRMLAYLIVWIVCKLSAQFNGCPYGLFIICVFGCWIVCLLFWVIREWLFGRSIVFWMIGLLLGTKWWNILLFKLFDISCYLVYSLLFSDSSLCSYQLRSKNRRNKFCHQKLGSNKNRILIFVSFILQVFGILIYCLLFLRIAKCRVFHDFRA